MTRDEALVWGRGDTRRVRSSADYPAEVLALVDERQGGRHCVYCQAAELVTPDEEPLEIDHLQPLSRGGDNNHRNLQWACRAHNRGRAARAGAPAVPKWARRGR